MAAQDDKSGNGVGFDVVAVLPAGGCGVRMNMELPKQVRESGKACENKTRPNPSMTVCVNEC